MASHARAGTSRCGSRPASAAPSAPPRQAAAAPASPAHAQQRRPAAPVGVRRVGAAAQQPSTTCGRRAAAATSRPSRHGRRSPLSACGRAPPPPRRAREFLLHEPPHADGDAPIAPTALSVSLSLSQSLCLSLHGVSLSLSSTRAHHWHRATAHTRHGGRTPRVGHGVGEPREGVLPTAGRRWRRRTRPRGSRSAARRRARRRASGLQAVTASTARRAAPPPAVGGAFQRRGCGGGAAAGLSRCARRRREEAPPAPAPGPRSPAAPSTAPRPRARAEGRGRRGARLHALRGALRPPRAAAPPLPLLRLARVRRLRRPRAPPPALLPRRRHALRGERAHAEEGLHQLLRRARAGGARGGRARGARGAGREPAALAARPPRRGRPGAAARAPRAPAALGPRRRGAPAGLRRGWARTGATAAAPAAARVRRLLARALLLERWLGGDSAHGGGGAGARERSGLGVEATRPPRGRHNEARARDGAGGRSPSALRIFSLLVCTPPARTPQVANRWSKTARARRRPPVAVASVGPRPRGPPTPGAELRAARRRRRAPHRPPPTRTHRHVISHTHASFSHTAPLASACLPPTVRCGSASSLSLSLSLSVPPQ